MFRYDQSVESPLYKKLTRFISGNKKIPDFLNEISAGTQEVSQLREAILQGDSKHEIFDNQFCILYLLYLIKNGEFNENENQAITLLIFLMAKKSNYEVNVININDNNDNQSIQFKKQFIQNMVYKSKNCFDLALDEKQVTEVITNLRGVDAWVIKTNSSANQREQFLLNQIIEGSGPCLDGTIDEYRIPSIAIMNAFIQQINPFPINLHPIFGIISLETLKALHAAGFHPLQLHGAPFVRDNLEEAHGIKLTPLAMLLHDIYHAFSGSLLKKENHNYLFNVFIPKLESFIKKITPENHQDPNQKSALINLLQQFAYKLADMDVGLFVCQTYMRVEAIRASGPIFPAWINFNMNTVLENTPISSDCMVTELPHIVKFYADLYTAIPAEDSFIVDVFEKINPAIAKRVFNAISSSQDNQQALHIPFNIEPFEKFCEEEGESDIDELSDLLKSCQSPQEFIAELSDDYSELYVQLMRHGFFYLPNLCEFTDQNFQEINQVVNKFALIKEQNAPQFGLFDHPELINNFKNNERPTSIIFGNQNNI